MDIKGARRKARSAFGRKLGNRGGEQTGQKDLAEWEKRFYLCRPLRRKSSLRKHSATRVVFEEKSSPKKDLVV